MKKIERIPFPEFKKIYSRVPRLCVEVVMKNKKGILLVRRTIEPAVGKWHTPGGTVLKREDLHDTVKRVAKEELGLHVVVERLLGVIEYKSYRNHYSQDISVAFLVKNKTGKLPRVDADADKVAYFDILPKNMIPEQKAFYRQKLGMKCR